MISYYLKYLSTEVLLKFLGQLGLTLRGVVSLSNSIKSVEKFSLLPNFNTTPSRSVGLRGLLCLEKIIIENSNYIIYYKYHISKLVFSKLAYNRVLN